MTNFTAGELVVSTKQLPLESLAVKLARLKAENKSEISVTELSKSLGYQLCTFCRVGHRSPNPNSILYSSVDPEWFDRYWFKGYGQVDSTTLKAQQTMEIVVWNELKTLKPLQKELKAEAHLIGVGNGVSVPLHLPNGTTFIGKFATRSETVDKDTFPMLWLITYLVRSELVDLNHHRSFGKAVTPIEEKLTTREIECLQCTGRGFTTKEVGLLLDLSDNTVHGYLTSAMRKLGVTNRVAAVVKAFALGLIEI